MSLMFYCLLGVTAEHAASGTGNAEQDLGTGASLQCEGVTPPCHLPQQDPRGTVLGPPPSSRERWGGAGGAGAAKQRWLGVAVGHSLRRGAGGQHRTSPGRAQGPALELTASGSVPQHPARSQSPWDRSSWRNNLCSRSPHLCLPGWWTPGFCHTWHSGSRTCARTSQLR